MSENKLQVLIEKFAADDKLREEALKITDKDSLRKLVNDYDKSIKIDDNQAQELFENLQNFLKLDSDDNGDLSLNDLDAVSGGGKMTLTDKVELYSDEELKSVGYFRRGRDNYEVKGADGAYRRFTGNYGTLLDKLTEKYGKRW